MTVLKTRKPSNICNLGTIKGSNSIVYRMTNGYLFIWETNSTIQTYNILKNS